MVRGGGGGSSEGGGGRGVGSCKIQFSPMAWEEPLKLPPLLLYMGQESM